MTNFRQGGFSQMPTVVKNLIIINVLMFLFQNVMGPNVDNYLALHYWQSPYFHWWQLITHMFMHAGLMHILFNMFALWMFGSILENSTFGPQRFLMFYLICGLGAAICHLTVLGIQFQNLNDKFVALQESLNPADYPAGTIEAIRQNIMIRMNEATVGASGAVFGLLFAFGYLFPNTELMLLFPPIPIKAKWFVAGYAVLELVSGLQNSAGDNVAHFAHLGGMLFAFILLKVWNIRRSRW